MKLDKSDIHLLFGPAVPPGAALPIRAQPVPPAAPPDPATPPVDKAAPHDEAALLFLLKKVSPALWRKLDSPRLTRRELRTKYLELIRWFCDKNKFDFVDNAKQVYVLKHRKVEGRLHAVISQGRREVALELCFDLDEASVYKLRSAYLQGRKPLLLWMGSPTSRAELLARAAHLSSVAASAWLDLVVLAESSPVQGAK